MQESLYTLDDFEADVSAVNVSLEDDLEAEIEIPPVPLRPQTPNGWDVADMEREIERCAKKLTTRICMGLNFICMRQNWELVTPDEFEDFKEVIKEIMEYHPILAKGGRILTYLDGAIAIPEFYVKRMMFKGGSEPKQQTTSEAAEKATKPVQEVEAVKEKPKAKPSKGGFV